MKTSRQLVYDTLLRVTAEDAYSNLAFSQEAAKSALSKEETAFAAALFYGTLERAITLDHALSPYLKKGVSSLDREILLILRMGLYQLCFMDGVPESAAVNESVKLTEYARKKSAKGLVNALLRNFIRNGKQIAIPADPQSVSEMAVAYSCPEWLLRLWCAQYGEAAAKGIAAASLGRPPIALRVNTTKTTKEELTRLLRESGVTVTPHTWLDNCLLVSGTGGIDSLPAFREGLFHIQDVSSQICAAAVGAQPGERVLDCCSAPGSKSFTIAEHMQNRGQILACDLYPHRLRLIEESAGRLGLTVLRTAVQDGTQPVSDGELFDRILCDVPCSGLGVIRRKPEIKEKAAGSLDTLPPIQLSILRNASKRLKPGGRLVYSTCTLNRKENERVVERFLQENNSFKPLQLSQIFDKIKDKNALGTTFFPGDWDGDGFYIAILEKTE